LGHLRQRIDRHGRGSELPGRPLVETIAPLKASLERIEEVLSSSRI
jgi:hypothetical protein